MVGMARKKENSAAERLSAPISSAPTMVAPERDMPGITARHWKRPILQAERQREIHRRRGSSASARSRSIQSSTNAAEDQHDADQHRRFEQHRLDEVMRERRRRPPPAGRRAGRRGRSGACAGRWGRSTQDLDRAGRNRRERIARIAPSWIRTSKALPVDSKPRKWPASRICPVEETGMNSVSPSIRPSTRASISVWFSMIARSVREAAIACHGVEPVL